MALLFLLPVSNNELKIACLGAVALVVGLEAIAKRAHPIFTRTPFAFALIFAAFGAFLMVLGIVRNNPGAWFVSGIFVIWPLVYQWILLPLRFRGVVSVLKVLTWCTIAMGLIALLFLGTERGLLSSSELLNAYPDMAVVEYDGYTQMRFYAISTLVFAVPFLIASFVVPRELINPIGSRSLRMTALVLGLAVAVLSGRRALWLVAALAPAVAWGPSLHLDK